MTTERFRGSIKWFDPKKGFGFITPDSTTGRTQDVFVHKSALDHAGIHGEDLYDGRRVEFSQEQAQRGPKKPSAVKLKLLD